MQRSTLTLGTLLLALVAVFVIAPQGAWAQDEGDAAEAPAAAAAEPAPAEGAAPAPADRTSYLGWAYKSLGLGYSIVFLALSFTLVSLLVMNLIKATRASIAPPDLVEAFEAHLNAKQFSEAYELANADDSFLGKVLAAGLGRLSNGGDYPRAIEAMQEVGEEENMKLDHRLSYMALIGTIAPMIGLLGTVQGMIASFDVIATSPTTPKPSELAEGIATALFTTLVGLVIAIPAIAAYNILRNRVAELVLQAGIVSEGLMSRFEKSR
ncbi:MotA/TolQ/ExbB proton channel family protein [Botrimarina mediterranea]|uniref:MotA/TolQ/ExbB proton channel family protein n=1 Tax=Botrimarina mediterranea TaxID=2528022 RepID=UPI00118A45DC|nr:Biopolymer transport protein ExbB [Planctomycetes bacterium K2D]